MSSRRRTILRAPSARVAAIVGVATLVVAACSEGTLEQLQEHYRENPSDVTPLPEPRPDARTEDDSSSSRPPLEDGETRRSVTPGAVVSAVGIDCPFDTSTVGEVTCGEVTVPGRGSAASDVTLTYAWFRSSAPPEDRRPDPVVYLHGGPGGEIVEFADLFAYAVVDPFIDRRDVIVYDQRGAGLSSPLPPCTRAWDLEPEYYSDPTPHEELSLRYVLAISGCGGSLGLNTEFDLSTYSSAVHADDLVDLRTALGIGAFNLYGSSYGSRLAQTVMRDHPDDVRTVIMSGVYPIEENLIGSAPETFRLALTTIFEACAADADCDAALPDPWATLQSLVDRLDADPVVTTVPLDAGAEFDLAIAGDDLINSIHAALYRWDVAAMVPDLLIDLEDGDSSRLERLARDSIADISYVAPYLTVQCHEEVPFTSIPEIDAAHTGIDAVDRIDLPPGLLGSELVEICAAWDVGPVDTAENDPVTWGQPTLLFSGGFDPITPASWAASMAARLPSARLVHSVDLGHDSDESFCTQQIMTEFLDDPVAPVSTSCAEIEQHATLDGKALRWISETAPELSNRSVDLSPGGGPDTVDVVTPEWLTDRNGDARIWWRDLDALDLTALVIAPGPVTAEEVEPYLDVEGPIGELRTTSSEIAGWDRSEMSTAGMNVVVYQRSAPFEVSVLLVAYDDDLDVLEQSVLAPAVESITPG